MQLKLTESEAYTLALAIDDAIAAQQRAETQFRTTTAYTPEQRERLALSCKDRATELQNIRNRIDA
jgi:hypothetical protein